MSVAEPRDHSEGVERTPLFSQPVEKRATPTGRLKADGEKNRNRSYDCYFTVFIYRSFLFYRFPFSYSLQR